MNLPGYLYKSAGRIELLALCIGFQRLYAREFHALFPEVGQGPVYQCSADTVLSMGWKNGKIGDGANLGVVINAGGNVADNRTVHLCHKDTGGIGIDIMLYLTLLTPGPVFPVRESEVHFDISVNR